MLQVEVGVHYPWLPLPLDVPEAVSIIHEYTETCCLLTRSLAQQFQQDLTGNHVLSQGIALVSLGGDPVLKLESGRARGSHTCKISVVRRRK